MRKAKIFVNGVEAAILTEIRKGRDYMIEYLDGYGGPEISRTMMPDRKVYRFDEFPPFFDGLLSEGIQLDGLLSINKIDRDDCFSQLMAVGNDMVGAVTVAEIKG